MKMKSLVLSLAVVMTLIFSSFAEANFLGMDDTAVYTWGGMSLYQNVVDAEGHDIEFGYQEFGDLTQVADKLVGNYLWGVMNLGKVQNLDAGPSDVWPESGTPLSVTGVFWGLKIESVDPVTGRIDFSGGEGKFYSSETTDVTVAPSAPAADTTDITNGVLNLDWFKAQYGAALALDDELMDYKWVPGVDPTDANITQTANIGNQQAQGTFLLDIFNGFGDHIDSNFYKNLVEGVVYDASGRGTSTIQLEAPNGWDFQSNGGTTLTMKTVPEPSSFILIGIGLAGCFLYTRRQKNLI